MAAVNWPAQGTVLSYSTNAGNTYTVLGQVTSLSAPGGEVGKRETTTLASTAKTYAPTIPDNGEVTFSLNYDPTDTGHQQVYTWKDSPAATTPMWKFAFNTGNTVATKVVTAFVSALDGPHADSVDDNLTLDVTLQISGTTTSVP